MNSPVALLRLAVAFDFLTTAAPLICQALQIPLRPTYLTVAGRELPESLTPALMGLDIFYTVILLVAWIGIFRRRRFARPLYLVAWVLSLVFVYVRGDDAFTITALILQLLVGFSGGFLVAVIYLSDSRHEFAKLKVA